MSTGSRLRIALLLSLSASAFACSSPPADTQGNGEGDSTESPSDAKTPSLPSSSSSSSPSSPSSNDPKPADPTTPPAPAAAPIPMAKVHEGNVWDYAVTDAAVFVATDTVVERTAPDGAGAAPIPELSTVNALATDGARVYALVDQGSSMFEIKSVKIDGTDAQHHLSWNAYYNGEPTSLSVHNARVFFNVTKASSPSSSLIASITAAPPLGGGNVPWTREVFADARFVPPTFTADRLFAVDFYRQGDLPASAAGIAANGTDVFVRTAKGIGKVAASAAAGTAPTVVVPSTACSVVDPGDGSESVLEDTLVADGGTIYAACRAGANVEVRAYDANGAQQKIVATTPYTGALTRLRLTKAAVYWTQRSATADKGDELWRAGR